jgi:2-oxoglutarate ferredoxin oxidoreductase subunit alpha
MMCNEAVAEAAIRAGCRFFAGYPISPATEVLEYMARHMAGAGGVCMLPESELSVVNILIGASSTGARVMTATSGPGWDLMQEGVREMAFLQLPAVIVDVCRAPIGIGPSQGDYFQCTKGGGHGDYRLIVLAPATVQEAVRLTRRAFWLADRYRTPVVLLTDSLLGHTSEPVAFDETPEPELPAKTWAVTGAVDRSPNRINTEDKAGLAGDSREIWGGFEAFVRELKVKYDEIAVREARAEHVLVDDAQVLIVAFGTAARVARTAVAELRTRGIRAGLIRPITLLPFPAGAIAEAATRAEDVLTVELNTGQMVEDVERAVAGRARVRFLGRQGGVVPSPDEIVQAVEHRVAV